MKITSMVDMSLTTEERAEMLSPPSPRYPYGLCLSLCEDELEKLGLDDEDVEVGDMIHFMAMAKVTSVSSRDDESGPTCRIELQITNMSAAEDEDKEDLSVKKVNKLYKA